MGKNEDVLIYVLLHKNEDQYIYVIKNEVVIGNFEIRLRNWLLF